MAKTYELATNCPTCNAELVKEFDHEPSDADVQEFMMGDYVRDHRPACIAASAS